MPCRREAEGEDGDDSFLLLQQSMALGGSADVDPLIAQIGETLQLDAVHDGPAWPSAAPGPPRVVAALPADKARARLPRELLPRTRRPTGREGFPELLLLDHSRPCHQLSQKRP